MICLVVAYAFSINQTECYSNRQVRYCNFLQVEVVSEINDCPALTMYQDNFMHTLAK